MNNKQLLEKLFANNDLTSQEIRFLLKSCIAGELTDSQIAALLIGLRMKGETVEEIRSLIEGMREHIVTFPATAGAVDTCGTGGDGTGTFNISTTVAFVVAGAGVPVVKHGNKAASSKCGSADVLSALGVHIMLTPQQAAKILDKIGMVFLFAPLYHPAIKRIGPIRKELETRTVFNFLGPFLNPARVKRQLIGVPNEQLAKKLAKVAMQLDYEHLILVSSDSGMDEIDITGETTLYEIKGNKIVTMRIHPQKLGFQKATKEDLHGGTISENAQIIRDILEGEKGAKRDIVVLNSAYVLYVSGKAKDITEGIKIAQMVIDSGAGLDVLENLIKETRKYID